MIIDVVILSHGKTPELVATTQNAINSCLASETENDFNIIVIEQQLGVCYKGCAVVYDNSEFNYNKFMNKGIELGNAPYVAICNNDLIFSPNWARILISAMQKHELLSACPICPHVQPGRLPLTEEVYFGYRNSHEVSGWCIMMNRDILKIIGKLDEDFPFWFADNIYSEQLKKHGIKHGVVSKSVVEHIRSKTLNTLDKETHDSLTNGLIERFVETHPENESAVFFKRHIKKEQP